MLDENDDEVNNKSVRYGEVAHANMIQFLRRNGITANAIGTIVKAMRELQTHCVLYNLINAYNSRQLEGKFVDPLPSNIQATFLHYGVEFGRRSVEFDRRSLSLSIFSVIYGNRSNRTDQDDQGSEDQEHPVHHRGKEGNSDAMSK